MIITIKPLRAGDLPRKAIVTKSTIVGGLITYSVKALVGQTAVWKGEFDWMVESGQWTIVPTTTNPTP